MLFSFPTVTKSAFTLQIYLASFIGLWSVAPAATDATKTETLPAHHPSLDGSLGTQLSWSPALESGWKKITERARGSQVRITMWGGSSNINQWVDQFVAKELKNRYQIELIRQPVKDPAETINKLLTEKKARVVRGTTDITWLNGENFKLAKNAALLYGPFTQLLPSYVQFYDHLSKENNLDFGTPVLGYEAPFGRAQFVFVYDSAKLKDPPKSYKELKAWVQKYPGKATYPAPPDFTGSAFIRQVFYGVTGGAAQYFEPGGLAKVSRNLPQLWAFLNDLKPYLWAKGKTYPDSSTRLNQMFADGEVLLAMGYSPTTAEADICKGALPKTVRTFVMEEGTLANTHFLGLPFNATNTDGALVVADFLLSPEAQLSKFDPSRWGDFPAVDLKRLPPELAKPFQSINLGVSTLPVSVLESHRVPELPPEILVDMEKQWVKEVAAK